MVVAMTAPARWEHTIDSMSVLEELSPDTLVFLQAHKRV